MGAPKGNQNAKGNKGGGRARAVDLKKFWALWNGEFDFESIKIKYHPDKGTYGQTPFDDLAWRVWQRDEKAINILRDKLFPRPVIRK